MGCDRKEQVMLQMEDGDGRRLENDACGDRGTRQGVAEVRNPTFKVPHPGSRRFQVCSVPHLTKENVTKGLVPSYGMRRCGEKPNQ